MIQKIKTSFQIDVEQYADKLAVAMTLSNITTVEIKPKGIIFKIEEERNPFDNFFDDQDQYANYRKVIRKCLPLRQKENFHLFNNKTIQEYLFAQDIIEFINSIDQYIDQILELRYQNGDQMVQSCVHQVKEKFESSQLKLKTNKSIVKLKSHHNLKYPLQILIFINLEKNLKIFHLYQVHLGEAKMLGAFKFIQIAIKSNQGLQEICQITIINFNALYILINEQQLKQEISVELILQIFHQKEHTLRNAILVILQYQGKVDLSRTDWEDIYTNDLPIIEVKQLVIHVFK